MVRWVSSLSSIVRPPSLRISRISLRPSTSSFVPSFRFNGIVYFERGVIKKNIHRLAKLPDSPLRKAAFLIRKIAIQSIRKAPMGGKPSRRLSKAKFHKGLLLPPKSRAPGHPMRMISAVPLNILQMAWIIGSDYLGSNPPVPGLHEHGGTAKRRAFVRFEPVHGPDGKYIGRMPTFTRGKVTVRYPPRPFMAPALNAAKHRLPELWRNSIR